MRVLGLDVGTKTIGVALSDEGGVIAHPLKTLKRLGDESDSKQLQVLCQQHQVGQVVVGLPLDLSGRVGKMASTVLRLVARLRQDLKVEVVTWDERFTTSQAERTLLSANVKRQARKEVVDQMAAALILQGFLDHQGSHSLKDDNESEGL